MEKLSCPENVKLNYFLKRRYGKTFSFFKKHIPVSSRILDLGVTNQFSDIMRHHGYKVKNTDGEDLDHDFSSVDNSDFDVITSFEVFEHLLAPYNILTKIKANKLVASIPLHMFFAKAYWNNTDERDCHFHEFELRQFNFLLKKSGWKIVDSMKWTAPVRKIGFRPILRLFVPRYYIVYCERIK